MTSVVYDSNRKKLFMHGGSFRIYVLFLFSLFFSIDLGLTRVDSILHQSSSTSIILSWVYFMVSISPGSRCVYNTQIID